MATLYTHQFSNVWKTWFLMGVFFVLVIALGWVVSWYYGNPVLLWLAAAFALFMNAASYWYSDKIVIRITGARPADSERYRELHRVVENLAITAGIPKPKVYVIDDPAPNAFATGRDPAHSAVAFTTGLLALLDRSELEGVAAHELSHIGNRDILVSTVAVVLAGFVALLADLFMRSLWFGASGRDRDSRAGVFILIAAIALSILAPLAATLIQLAVSRKREFLADASGALLTRYPEGLARALEKIASSARPMRRANHATAHLFIADPFGRQRGIAARLQRLFMTHPPVEERVHILRTMGTMQ